MELNNERFQLMDVDEYKNRVEFGMSAKFATELTEQVNLFCKRGFTLTAVERHCEDNHVSWRAEIRAEALERVACTGEWITGFFVLTSQQYYQATNFKNAEENYNGMIEFKLEIAAVNDLDERAKTMGEMILRLAKSHYAEKVMKFYPDWGTNYMNEPEINISSRWERKREA